MPFGQLVIGPPGSGKTTYCRAVQQFLRLSGRKVAIVNLDPANDTLPYQAAVDVSELVHLEQIMDELKLGPNGGLVYAMEYLEKNIDWLMEKLEPLEKDGYYFLFDLPGQLELFTMHDSLRHIVDTMASKWHYRLTAVHLVDAHLCSDPSKYISALLASLSSMLHLELPHINVLSKVDLVQQYGELDFTLDFYTEVQDLSYLIQSMGTSDRFSQKYRKLSKGLCELIQDFALVTFLPMSIKEPESMRQVLNQVDKANGYALSGLGDRSPYANAYADTSTAQWDVSSSLNEKYVVGNVEERLGEGGPAPGDGPADEATGTIGKKQ